MLTNFYISLIFFGWNGFCSGTFGFVYRLVKIFPMLLSHFFWIFSPIVTLVVHRLRSQLCLICCDRAFFFFKIDVLEFIE